MGVSQTVKSSSTLSSLKKKEKERKREMLSEYTANKSESLPL